MRASLPESLPTQGLKSASGRVLITELIITRQRPGTAAGVIFLTLEDETGTANIIVWKQVYESFGQAVVTGRLLRIKGRVQRDGAVCHLIAEHVKGLSHRLGTLSRPLTFGAIEHGGETQRQIDQSGRRTSARHPREQAKKIFPSRDFY